VAIIKIRKYGRKKFCLAERNSPERMGAEIMKKLIWVGDSTVAFNGAGTYPQTGIGQEFDRYLKRDYVVFDFAKNGASSKSFYDAGRFEPAEEIMEEGDFLFIQFGHNDEKPQEDRHTEPDTTYQEYLMRYVDAARKKGAVPVLITPLSRRLFQEDGTIQNSHGAYPAAVKALAEREHLAVIDLTEKSRILYEKTGDMESRKWFMYFPLGTYENYTKDMKDNTHLHYEGAVKMGGLVAEGLKELGGIYAEMLA
jgi:lysophospholipase L1-like esterase